MSAGSVRRAASGGGSGVVGPGRRTAVEIAVQDVAGARLARDLGADRVELCVALGLTGGLTPGIGLVRAVVEVGLPVHVLVRHRPGGFVYSDDEADALEGEVRALVLAGAAGVVVGALTPGREVDSPRTAALVRAADGAEVTFHRAFDVVDDRAGALEVLAGLGVTRVLTSAGAERAGDAVAALGHLARRAGGRIQVMAGGGVRPQDVGALVTAGVDAVHLSARGPRADAGPAGPGGGQGVALDATDGAVVAEAVAAARAADRLLGRD